jgi:hypothetical protein
MDDPLREGARRASATEDTAAAGRRQISPTRRTGTRQSDAEELEQLLLAALREHRDLVERCRHLVERCLRLHALIRERLD